MTINKPCSDLDSRDLFTNLEESVATLYGQLMVVGKHGRPNMLQETAREFLISGRTYFEFLIYKTMSYGGLSHLSRTGRNKASKELATLFFGKRIRLRRLSIHSILVSPLEIQPLGRNGFLASCLVSEIRSTHLGQNYLCPT
ncbi:uncharacterized protein FOBCDRAFT_206558 [Fusarium oxysporum Fo47]|uniref:uncharacterized protein n=1 Tax=Fusarium oxysporum Fo47 TaxID=660027 RepID=UPI002869B0F9|nr:uncharacterized protein FOBCDRAFT_206558 [Fusarium oxysporum Fo47]WJG36149.1 hypothetical protein FOBCDRAFT_206558 [Fusarium oxysporum Fo47]